MNKTDIYQKRRATLAKKIQTNTGGGVAALAPHKSAYLPRQEVAIREDTPAKLLTANRARHGGH